MKHWRYGLIIIIGILFYFPIFYYGFSQDDFIHLSASRVNSIGEVLNFFNPFARFPDIFFFRPLATQFWFFINDWQRPLRLMKAFRFLKDHGWEL